MFIQKNNIPGLLKSKCNKLKKEVSFFNLHHTLRKRNFLPFYSEEKCKLQTFPRKDFSISQSPLLKNNCNRSCSLNILSEDDSYTYIVKVWLRHESRVSTYKPLGQGNSQKCRRRDYIHCHAF